LFDSPMPALIPTVSLGRLEYDAAHRVLNTCSSARQKQALPYLLSLYAFINWWENYASWGLPAPDLARALPEHGEDDFWGEEVAGLNWEIELVSTWCERPEIVELIDIADLTIQGVTLGIYPVDPQDQLILHGPTLLGVIKADLCVGVRLDLSQSTARMLGFIPTSDLLTLWQTTPPNAQGFFRLPATCLQPIHALPPQVSRVQALSGSTPHPEVPQEPLPVANPQVSAKSGNVPSQTPDRQHMVQQLQAVGLSPSAGEDGLGAVPVVENEDEAQEQAAALHRLIGAYQDYHEQSRLLASLRKRLEVN
jgi:hypothetical protein